MDVRRVTAAAGAVGINALAGFAMLDLSGHVPTPARHVDPVIARVIEPPPVAPRAQPLPAPRPEPAAVREPPPARPLRAPAAPPKAEDAPPALTPTPAPAASEAAAPPPAVLTAQTPTASAPPVSLAATAPSTPDVPHRTTPRADASWAGNAPPPYPASARRLGEQGEVRLDVHVGADGTVLEVALRASSGSPALDRSAMDTVRRWRFRPATVDGQAVPEWYRDWKWVFRLEG